MSRPPDSTKRAQTVKRNGPLRGLLALRHSYTYNGFVATIRHESAFRQDLAAAVVLVPCALVMPLSTVERVMLVATTLLVLLVELINSAVEAAIDRISTERHELSGRAKDCGSGAVTVPMLSCAINWAMLCDPHFTGRLKSLL